MLLGDAERYYAATAKLLLICQLYLTECVDDGRQPSDTLISSGTPVESKRPTI